MVARLLFRRSPVVPASNYNTQHADPVWALIDRFISFTVDIGSGFVAGASGVKSTIKVTPEETPQHSNILFNGSIECRDEIREEGVNVVRQLGYLGCCSFYDVYVYIVLYVVYPNLVYRCGDMVLCGGLVYLAGRVYVVGHGVPYDRALWVGR